MAIQCLQPKQSQTSPLQPPRVRFPRLRLADGSLHRLRRAELPRLRAAIPRRNTPLLQRTVDAWADFTELGKRPTTGFAGSSNRPETFPVLFRDSITGTASSIQ